MICIPMLLLLGQKPAGRFLHFSHYTLGLLLCQGLFHLTSSAKASIMIEIEKVPMPRKNKQIDRRRRRDDLRTLSRDSREYWEEVLRREGLMMTAGYNPRRLVYVGTANDLEMTHEGVVRRRYGK